MCKVSVVVPCYNVEKYLVSFMNSLAKQVYKDVEIIFVNDGSTDNTTSLLENFQLEFDNLIIIHQSNSGLGEARNVGLRNSKGKYVIFLDPDDIVNETILEDNIFYMEKHNVDLLMFGMGYIDESDRILDRKTTLNSKNNMIINADDFKNCFQKLFFETSFFSACNKIYRRSFLMKNDLSFPNSRTGQDSIFNCKVFECATSIYVNRNVYYLYRFGRQGSAATRQVDEQRIVDDNEVCLEFDKLVCSKELSKKYLYNLSFQKINKLYEKIELLQANKDLLMHKLFSQSIFKLSLKLRNIVLIHGWKKKIKFMYILVIKSKYE